MPEIQDLHGSDRNTAVIAVMRIEDYDEVIALWNSVPGMGMNDVDDSREGIGRYLKRNPTTSFVARADGRLVGCILAGHDGRRGWLYHAAVLPEMQGRGIGNALVQNALDALKAEGISKAGMIVFNNNVSGNKYWDKHGFADRSDVRYRSKKLVELKEKHT